MISYVARHVIHLLIQLLLLSHVQLCNLFLLQQCLLVWRRSQHVDQTLVIQVLPEGGVNEFEMGE